MINFGQEDSSTVESSNAIKEPSKSKSRSSQVEISKPTVLRLVKSLSDFHSLKRKKTTAPKDELSLKKELNHLSDDLEFDSWYSGQREELIGASQNSYRSVWGTPARFT
jgi:hypothetical protein